jgi:endoplasmic reticulum lectin 1
VGESSWSFRAKYEKGTKCDLTNERRSSKVNFVCDPKGETHITSIVVFRFFRIWNHPFEAHFKETTSCNYEVNVNTPLLCKHPQYKVSETEKDTKIYCLESPIEPSHASTTEKASEKKGIIHRLLRF